MSSLKQLREQFTKVLIRYTNKSCTVMLVDGLNVYKGKSHCHESDNFNRKLGRTIALGRAEFAFKVDKGLITGRKNKHYLGEEVHLHNTFKYGDVKEVDECIINFLPKVREA